MAPGGGVLNGAHVAAHEDWAIHALVSLAGLRTACCGAIWNGGERDLSEASSMPASGEWYSTHASGLCDLPAAASAIRLVSEARGL